MSYSQLYHHCQSLTGRIGRRQLFPKVAELTKLPKPLMQLTSKLNPRNLRGFIYFPNGSAHRLSEYCRGRPLIVVARELDVPWQRFVMIKELMHYFDEGVEKVSTSDEFEQLVSEISGAMLPTQSPAMRSEATALWMAFGVICQEDRRQDFQRRRESKEITDEEIAAELGVPINIVTHLFEPHFKAVIDSILKAC